MKRKRRMTEAQIEHECFRRFAARFEAPEWERTWTVPEAIADDVVREWRGATGVHDGTDVYVAGRAAMDLSPLLMVPAPPGDV